MRTNFNPDSHMTELSDERKQARPDSGRACFKRVAMRLPSAKEQIEFWSIIVVGLVIDLVTKWVVLGWVERSGPIEVLDGVVRFVKVENPGAAFGLFAGMRVFLIVVTIVGFFLILGIFLFARMPGRLQTIALGLLAAGTCGTAYDRLFNAGLVRDFIDVVYWPGRHWPAFNAADSMLCIGVALMIITAYVTERPCRKRARQQK